MESSLESKDALNALKFERKKKKKVISNKNIKSLSNQKHIVNMLVYHLNNFK
jgi:hypothetical protein